ncbi:uncharacterized protein HMPREF1541_08099 [Cyphellophora europaea CBS 101466]|uniref:Uncharacterized protein n=1 Tax=Cyphellophora europaea (strain CBS 101466) TaxID=1220924 RepID=W2RMZ4_CYPE1|nr:uncharacterized protein HMPREF1541_08099 [Cyphellophora europaea CBS 101466]ETN37109.1 hypothetical protein HMPREF1541_08099 [Cyphellophora europaea CBS 101466]
MPSLHLIPRADDDDIVCNYWGCVSYTSYVIKWAVFGGLMAACLLFFFGGYIHAKQRMKKGLAPLSYHRWMIPRRQRIAFHAAHPNLPNPYIQRQWYTPGYGMHPVNHYGPPPPQYGTPEWLPAYAPPADGSNVNAHKTNPNQAYAQEVGTTSMGPSMPSNAAGQGR